MKKIYFILVLWVSLNTYAFTQCNNPDDYAALYALYNSTDGANWTNNTNWDVSAVPPAVPAGLDMSTWYGITCGGGRVTEVHLGNNNLIGSIPAQLGNLANLERLYLYSNQLTGSIPAQLGNLVNLKYLYLYNNQLTGSIPAQLGNLANLMELDLDNNQLTGSIPAQLGNLANLKKLYLYNNQLTGSIPAQLGNLANLKVLYLDYNQLTGSIPNSFNQLSGLTTLGLSNNQLSGCYDPALKDAPSVLCNFTNAGISDGNSFDAPWENFCNFDAGKCVCDNPDDYAALYALYNSTDGANWTDNTNWDVSAVPPAVPAGLDMSTWYGITCGGGRVTVVDLGLNHLIGSIPAQLGNLANLKYLYLYENQLTGSIPAQLGNLANLKKLYLSTNQLTGSIPAQLGNLANLDGLYLYNNQLTGSIPTQLDNLANLRNLSLRENQLTGSIPAQLGNLANLEVLSLSDNQLTGSIPAQLGNLANLRNLSLRENQLTGSIPAQLGNLAILTDLYLNNNQLTGSIPVQLGNLANLESLQLHSNQLTGSILAQLGNLTNLEGLSLHENQLTGSIPAQLGNLANLLYLYLSTNQLTGSIPAQLGNLANLEHLLLDNNQLTGSIPNSFNQLSGLTTLGLSNNQLSGCYDPALKSFPSVLCNFTNADISDGNSFDAPWENFCDFDAGSCCGTNIWNGNVDNNWETPGNWNKGYVPLDCQDVIISGVGVTVNVNSTTAKAASVSIVNGNTLTVKAGAVLTIDGNKGTFAADGINVSGVGAVINNMGSIVCKNLKRKGLNIDSDAVFNNSGSLQISNFNIFIQAYHGIAVSLAGQLNNTGSISINSSVSHNDTDGISCKSNAVVTNSGSISITNIQGPGSEAITNESTFNNENAATITINTVGNSYGLLNTAAFNNNGSMAISNTGLNGIQNTGGGIFGGNGSATMNTFENAATLSPGNSPGAITLNGDFNTSSSYHVEINSKAGVGIGHDHLQVNGDVSLDGDILVDNNTMAGTLLDEDKFVVLSYTGTRTGVFSTEKLNGFPVNWAVTYDAQYCGKCIVVHGPTAVLPVKLTSFTARKTGKEVSLQWTTDTEVNNKGFSVTHSTDGKNWQNIAWVEGSGTSTLSNTYQYVHQKPTNGYNYYRLQQMDFDGKLEYSKIVNVVFNNGQDITLYPNPATNVLHISGKNLNDAVLSIYDALGQKMTFTLLRKENKEIALNLSDFRNGLYSISIFPKNGQAFTQQLIIAGH